LEVLLLLHRTSERWWTAAAVNAELRTSLQSAAQYLEELDRSGLLEEGAVQGERAFRFRARDPDTLRAVVDLSNAFKFSMGAIIDLVYAPRRTSIREFADAFRLTKSRKDPDDG
jgi:hypothetical protein